MSLSYASFSTANRLCSLSLLFHTKCCLFPTWAFSPSLGLSNSITMCHGACFFLFVCLFFCARNSLNVSELWVRSFQRVLKILSHCFVTYSPRFLSPCGSSARPLSPFLSRAQACAPADGAGSGSPRRCCSADSAFRSGRLLRSASRTPSRPLSIPSVASPVRRLVSKVLAFGARNGLGVWSRATSRPAP